MICPEALEKDEPLTWSTGTGADVWEMFCAAIAGDVPSLQRLLDKDPSLVRGQYAYLTPLYFAVRENQAGAAAFLLERGANPMPFSGGHDSLLDIARDRGYAEMLALLESTLARVHFSSPTAITTIAAGSMHPKRPRPLRDRCSRIFAPAARTAISARPPTSAIWSVCGLSL